MVMRLNADQMRQIVRDLEPRGLTDFRIPDQVTLPAMEGSCAGLVSASIGRGYGWFDDTLQPHGMLVGFILPDPFTGVKTGYEHVWWVAPERRGAASLELLRAFENDCRAEGCRRVLFGTSSFVSEAKMLRMYRRQGYKAYGQTVAKEL